MGTRYLSEVAMEFGEAVEKRRKFKERTQADCAGLVPCSIRTWQRVEKGKLPEEKNARIKLENNVARVLELPLAELKKGNIEYDEARHPLDDSHLVKEKLRAVILKTVKMFPRPEGKPASPRLIRWQNQIASFIENIDKDLFGEQKDESTNEERRKALEMVVEIINEELKKY